ncbi:MAG: pyocin knob domain-containing protein [Bacillota bacterium]|nr:pyocin knob domain-containing protein [Bacillota bacterium]
MATNSTNYNLIKPDGEDYYDITEHNSNVDIIDGELKRLADGNLRTASGDSLGALTDAGTYPLPSLVAFSDRPASVSTSTKAVLIVHQSDTALYQELVVGAKHYSRAKTGESWSAWLCHEDATAAAHSAASTAQGTANSATTTANAAAPATSVYTKAQADARYATAAQGSKADTALQKVSGIVPGEASPIPQSTNLNDIKSAGYYKCIDNTTAVSLVNCPGAVGFLLEVLQWGSGNNTIQRLTPYSEPNRPVVRYLNGSSWSQWAHVDAQTLIGKSMSVNAISDTIALRSAQGALTVGAPTSDPHAATKKYVDDGLAPKLNSNAYTANDVLAKIKTVDGSGSGLDADKLRGLSPSASAYANTVVIRNASGHFSTPTPTTASHAANRGYVDDKLAAKVLYGSTVPATLLPGQLFIKTS